MTHGSIEENQAQTTGRLPRRAPGTEYREQYMSRCDNCPHWVPEGSRTASVQGQCGLTQGRMWFTDHCGRHPRPQNVRRKSK